MYIAQITHESRLLFSQWQSYTAKRKEQPSRDKFYDIHVSKRTRFGTFSPACFTISRLYISSTETSRAPGKPVGKNLSGLRAPRDCDPRVLPICRFANSILGVNPRPLRGCPVEIRRTGPFRISRGQKSNRCPELSDRKVIRVLSVPYLTIGFVFGNCSKPFTSRE